MIKVDEFITKIRDELFHTDTTVHLAIHSQISLREFVIDSLNVKENKAMYLVDLGAYDFKVIADKPTDCTVEIKSSLTSLISESFTGTYPCSTTLDEIKLSVHKYFSNPYSHGLYDSDEQILQYPPGEITPQYIPRGKAKSELYALSIESFRQEEGSHSVFEYTYFVVLRIESSKSSTPSPSEIHFSSYPLSTSVGPLFSAISKFSEDVEYLHMNPLTSRSAPEREISLSHYYASIYELSYPKSSQFMDIYSPAYPGLCYFHYDTAETAMVVWIKGDYYTLSPFYIAFMPQMNRRQWEMMVRRRMARISYQPEKWNTIREPAARINKIEVKKWNTVASVKMFRIVEVLWQDENMKWKDVTQKEGIDVSMEIYVYFEDLRRERPSKKSIN